MTPSLPIYFLGATAVILALAVVGIELIHAHTQAKWMRMLSIKLEIPVGAVDGKPAIEPGPTLRDPDMRKRISVKVPVGPWGGGSDAGGIKGPRTNHPGSTQ